MSLRVLLVEDNPVNRELVVDLLEAEGHAIDVAADGVAFRALLAGGAHRRWDVVLLDVVLPDADGVTLLGELRRALKVAPAPPVLAVTAQALASDRERLLAAGFDAVITKPIDTRTFAATVAGWAGRTG